MRNRNGNETFQLTKKQQKNQLFLFALHAVLWLKSFFGVKTSFFHLFLSFLLEKRKECAKNNKKHMHKSTFSQESTNIWVSTRGKQQHLNAVTCKYPKLESEPNIIKAGRPLDMLFSRFFFFFPFVAEKDGKH